MPTFLEINKIVWTLPIKICIAKTANKLLKIISTHVFSLLAAVQLLIEPLTVPKTLKKHVHSFTYKTNTRLVLKLNWCLLKSLTSHSNLMTVFFIHREDFVKKDRQIHIFCQSKLYQLFILNVQWYIWKLQHFTPTKKKPKIKHENHIHLVKCNFLKYRFIFTKSFRTIRWNASREASCTFG